MIGAGVAGLATAWLLARSGLRPVLFEREARLGGHANTVDLHLEGISHPVDTGFLVFNERTYPNLIALFDHLGIESVETEMSFSVTLTDPDLEWAGSNLATIFGQTQNLIRPGFWRMLSDILRFNRESAAWQRKQGPQEGADLRTFLVQGGYSDEFTHWYLLPMAGAIWSCPPAQMLDYPLATFLRFCHNHGLLQVFDRPRWRTVLGGSRAYVKRMAADLPEVRAGVEVAAVSRASNHVMVKTDQGVELFDSVVFATHSDITLELLGTGATAQERQLLSSIPYQRNRAVLHTDAKLLPTRRGLWSAWNYLGGTARPGFADQRPVAVSYLINRLQPLPFETPVVVTLNPQVEPDPATVIAEFDYAHPVFDQLGIAAQDQLTEIQGCNHSWFAGAWTSYGFHEDGLKSAIAVATKLGARLPWQQAAAYEML